MSHATDGGGTLEHASNIDLLRVAQDELNRKELSCVRKMCTTETTCNFPDRTCIGVDDITAYFREMFTAIPDRHVEVVAMVESGEDVLMRFRMTGTQEGPFGDLPATGKPLVIDGFEHFIIRDGKIVSSFSVSDQLSLARQLGMIGPDGSVGDRMMKFAFRLKTKISRRRKPPAPAPA